MTNGAIRAAAAAPVTAWSIPAASKPALTAAGDQALGRLCQQVGAHVLCTERSVFSSAHKSRSARRVGHAAYPSRAGSLRGDQPFRLEASEDTVRQPDRHARFVSEILDLPVARPAGAAAPGPTTPALPAEPGGVRGRGASPRRPRCPSRWRRRPGSSTWALPSPSTTATPWRSRISRASAVVAPATSRRRPPRRLPACWTSCQAAAALTCRRTCTGDTRWPRPRTGARRRSRRPRRRGGRRRSARGPPGGSATPPHRAAPRLVPVLSLHRLFHSTCEYIVMSENRQPQQTLRCGRMSYFQKNRSRRSGRPGCLMTR